MSARLNMNELSLVSWKGRTFNQISSFIKKNSNINSSIRNTFSANPLKIYRREIANKTVINNCNPRTSVKIDIINMPNGSINNVANVPYNGLVNTIDINQTSISSEHPGSCTSCSVVGTPADNARRRVRSSGMIKRKYSTSNNESGYYTNSNQYLNSRNRTFQQNQFNYIKYGDFTAKPGDSLSALNVYAPNGPANCKKYNIISDVSFQYQWINGLFYTVQIPAGWYDVSDINSILKETMLINNHYYNRRDSGSNIYLLNIAWNNTNKRIELHALKADVDTFPSIEYSIPVPFFSAMGTIVDTTLTIDNASLLNPIYGRLRIGSIIHGSGVSDGTTIIAFGTGTGLAGTYTVSQIPNSPGLNVEISVAKTPLEWATPTVTLIPGFNILENIFTQAIGFPIGNYPTMTITLDIEENFISNGSANQVITSPNTPGLHSSFTQIYYKPSNSQFAQQGAVSASSLIARLKYNSITNSTAIYQRAYGKSVANALAYGVSENGYTIKDKIGYPVKNTPTFTISGALKVCSLTKISNSI